MPHIIVDDEQAKIISAATESVANLDRTGKQLGFVAHGFTDEDIALAKTRLASNEPRFTTAQVLNHLRSMEPQ